ncbi:sigma-54-dependent transcriptional regulator [Pseudoalteromonas luteoviolacea]|uniref:sigma-54-dependent transcriptional regulator n=1 Tax=Pseudoalteromonas luteoviolacea TaxID=43657 RepID=UPI001B372A1C|nr:sigma-54 dependent transcriptional regulator [Pseudoalteromonas luteoviolacea]MBQ4839708.1 sigma-54-dependent Fis family transcriptional regulator [Pseudoalteromonas luteoviolacea]
MSVPTILIIDDNIEVRLSAAYFLEDQGLKVLEAASPDEAKQLLSVKAIAIILLDMNFSKDTTSGQEGLDFLAWLKERNNTPAVLCITGWGNINLAVRALQLGACDFIEKPWQNTALLTSIQQQLKLQTRQQNQLSYIASQQTQTSQPATEFVWQSASMRALQKKLEKVVVSDASILLCGESGVGKSHFVSWLHQHSQRAQGPLVSVNMGALAESLFESELFGHVKGAFTDAKQNRTGRFTKASGGTLFMDEVATLSLPLQAKLLRVLETGEYEALGSSQTIRSDIRLICATNAHLPTCIEQGTFRRDLFYRINTLMFELPPLRERESDIVPLAKHLLAQHAKRYGITDKGLSMEVENALKAYPWPGNIRELSHVMERALLMSEGPQICLEDCQLRLAKQPAVATRVQTRLEDSSCTLADMEKSLIMQVLEEECGVISQAAQRLGLTKSSLYRRLDKYGLKDVS